MPKRKNKTLLQDSEKVEHKQGKPWTTVSVHKTYEAASKKVMEVIAANPTYSTKIRRTGDNDFKVVKRLDEKLDKVAKDMETKIQETESLKKKKKK